MNLLGALPRMNPKSGWVTQMMYPLEMQLTRSLNERTKKRELGELDTMFYPERQTFLENNFPGGRKIKSVAVQEVFWQKPICLRSSNKLPWKWTIKYWIDKHAQHVYKIALSSENIIYVCPLWPCQPSLGRSPRCHGFGTNKRKPPKPFSLVPSWSVKT